MSGDLDDLKAAGFNDTEVSNYQAGQAKQLGEAGFSDEEIKAHFGQPPVDPRPLQKLAAERKTNGIGDALQLGWQTSDTGLIARGKAPDLKAAGNMPWYQRIAQSAGQLGGDLPFMLAGGLAGGFAAAPGGIVAGAGAGAVVGAPTGPGEAVTIPTGAAIGGISAATLGAGAGANAVPEAVRSTLMDYYANGQIKDWGDFASRLGGVLWNTAKAGAVGAATAGVGGKVAQLAEPIVAPTIVKTAAQLVAEAGTYVTTSRALEGQVPTAQDFEDAGLLIGGLHAAIHLAPKLRDVYAKAGKTPSDVVQDSQSDVSVTQDMAADNVPVPARYAPLAEAEAPKEEAGVTPAASEQPTSQEEGSSAGATAEPTAATTPGQGGDIVGLSDLYKQTPEQLQSLHDMTGASDDEKLVQALGEDGAKDFKRLTSAANSSYDTEKADAASKELEQKFGNLTPEQNRLVYGVGEDAAPQAGDLKQMIDAHQDLTDMPDHYVGLRGANALMAAPAEEMAKVPQGQGSVEAQAAFVKMQNAVQEFVNRGVDPNQIPQKFVDALVSRGSSPSSAAEAVGGFFDDMRAAQARTATQAAPQHTMITYDLKDGKGPQTGEVNFSNAAVVGTTDGRVIDRDQIISQGEASAPAGTTETGADNKAAPEQPEGSSAAGNPPKPPEPGTPEAAQQAILSRIDIGGKDASKPRATFDDVYTAAVDDLNPIRKAVGSSGVDLPTDKDPYELARLTRGAAGRADHFLQYGTYDFNTLENNGPSLKEVLAPVSQDLDGFRAYAAASRALELNARDIETGIKTEDAQQVVDAGGAKYEDAFRGLVDYQDKVTQYLRDSGVLSSDGYDAMHEANNNYVPFYRVMDDGSVPGAGGVSGRSLTARNTIKGIKGSDSTIVDPIEGAIKNTYVMTAMAERNAVAQAFEKMPNSDAYLEKVVEPSRPITAGADEMSKFLAANGIDKAPDDLLTLFRSSTQPLRDDEIRVYNDGKPTTYKTDKDIARAFKGMDPQSASLFTKMLALPASLLRAGAVLTPDFALRHVFRDNIYSFITHDEKGNPANAFTPLDMARGLTSLLSHDEAYQAWLKSGGANITMVSMERRYLQANLEKLTQQTGLGNRVWNLVKSPLDAMRVTVELAENMSHVGAFKKALDVAPSEANRAQLLDAGFKSRATAVDTARIGANMRAFNLISAFANVTIQDSDRIVRAFKDNPVGTSAKVLSSIVLPSALLWYANHQDPRYQEIPDWEKDLFWIVMTKDHIYRVSKPFGAGVLFGSGTERLLQNMFTDDKHAFHGLDKSLADTLIPSAVPSALSPVLDQYANKSLFTGGNLIPDRLEKIMPEYQYNEGTTETAKALGKIMGAFPGMERTAIAADHPMLGGVARALTTPILLDNYVRGWAGGLGMYALQISDKALTAAGLVPDPVKPASTLSDIPVVKSFVVRYPSASAASIQNFYDRFAEKQIVWSTIQQKAKEGDPDAVLNAMRYDPSSVSQLTGMKQALTIQGQLISNINRDPNMSPSDKRQLIDTTYGRMIEIARSADKMLDQVDEYFQGKTPAAPPPGPQPAAAGSTGVH